MVPLRMRRTSPTRVASPRVERDALAHQRHGRPRTRGLPRQLHEPGFLVGPAVDPQQPAEFVVLDGGAVEDLDTEPSRRGQLLGSRREGGRRERAARLVDEVTGDAHRLGDGPSPLEGGADPLAALADNQQRRDAVGLGVGLQLGVPVGAEHDPLG